MHPVIKVYNLTTKSDNMIKIHDTRITLNNLHEIGGMVISWALSMPRECTDAREYFDTVYIYGGGWEELGGEDSSRGYVDTNMGYHYPNDPVLLPYYTLSLPHGQKLTQYPYEMFILEIDGKHYIQRMD